MYMYFRSRGHNLMRISIKFCTNTPFCNTLDKEYNSTYPKFGGVLSPKHFHIFLIMYHIYNPDFPKLGMAGIYKNFVPMYILGLFGLQTTSHNNFPIQIY